MSQGDYSTRLRWEHGRGGVARLHGVRIELPPHAQPRGVLPLDLILVDYTPEARVARVQPRCEPARDMHASEIQACETYLRRACAMEP